MRMEADREVGVVLEHHFYAVAHLAPKQWTQGAQVLLFCWGRFEFGEGLVGVLSVERLAVDLTYALWSLLHEDVFLLAELLTGNVVHVAWGVVPIHLVGCHVVGPRGGLALLSGYHYQCQHHRDQQRYA